MRYATANAFRTALEARLLARARETGVSIVRLRKTVVFDRLLARLLVVAPGRWHLKGALALDFRLGPGTRATKDMDLGRADDEAATTADFRAAQAVDLRTGSSSPSSGPARSTSSRTGRRCATG